MKNGVLMFWIGLIVLGSAAYGSWVVIRELKEHHRDPTAAPAGVATSPAEKGPTIKDFQLTERSNLPFHSKEVEGQVWIASFFFSNCDKDCWRLNQVLRTIQDEITDLGFRIVSISCDPEQDTPEVLQAYASRLGADRGRWVFLTGDLKYIQRIGKEIFLQEVAPGFHMNRALLVDRQGSIRGSFDLLDPEKVAEMKVEIRRLLAENSTGGEHSSDAATPGS
ncbi:MAG: SCO family protein [Pirellulales bacterium]|nr:SCO family protein [Pirellulales bacterium]